MSTPTTKSAFDWSQECDYIGKVTDKKGNVKEMNHDVGVFIRYCTMQRNDATHNGYHDSAQYIQHCLDDLGAA